MNFLFIIVLSSVIENIPAQESGRCGSWLNITLCAGGDMADLPEVSRVTETIIHAYYQRGKRCEEKQGDLLFDWEILAGEEPVETRNHTFFNYTHMENFRLEPYSFGRGGYTIHVYEKINNVREAHSQCSFQIIAEIPVPIIEGGSERTVANDQEFEVNGRPSINRDERSGKGKLEYEWKCDEEIKKEDNFCSKPIKNEPYVIVPKKYAIENQIFTFELIVRTDYEDGQPTKQRIIVSSHPTILEIRCVKNCPPSVLKTDSKQKTILKVTCKKNCVGGKSYKWTANFDYKTEGSNADTFTIKENVLKPGQEYSVSVRYEGTTGSTTQKITPHIPPVLDNCDINPKTGKAFTTRFVAECKYSGKGPYTFQIYSVEPDDSGILLYVGNALKTMKFVLGRSTKVKIVLVDTFRFTDSKTADVTVESGIKTNGTEEEIQQHLETVFYDKNSEDSLENLSKRKKYTGLLQGINSMTDVLNTIKADKPDIVKEYQVKNLQLLQEIPVDSLTFAEKVMSTANKIANQQQNISDPEVARLASDLCLKSSENYNALLKQEQYAGSFSKPALNIAQTAAKCSQVGTRLNKGFLQEYNVMYNTTESNITSDIADVEVVTENYPDYIDESDPKYKNTTKKIENYKKATENLIALCYSTAKTLSLTMVPEEKTKYTQTESFEVTATKMRDVTNFISISSQNITLVPSQDLETYNEEISVSMCTSKNNPFWWDANQPTPVTNIAMVRFETEEEIVKNFRSPFSIHFEFHKEFSPIEVIEGTTPRIWNHTTSKEEEEFERIGIYKIDVLSKRGFVVEFINLTENCSLEVFASHFEKVSIAEFHGKSTVITNTTNTLYTEHNLEYDSWYYLYVLPDKKMENNEVTFQFSVYTFFCAQWITTNRSWTFACQGSSNSSHSSIECLCYHSSVLMGQVSYNKVTEERTLIIENILDIRVNYTIFASVVVVFFLYCILMCFFASGDKILEQPVYFLTDVPSTDRFGYLLIVKTRNKINAGTTSNVIIQIYGNKSVSRKHLLNYPDPEKRILQKNGEDWFILATEKYLGDIEKIEVMFDSVGLRPSWYCSEVEIIDLQQNKYFLFSIDFQFEISIEENYFYSGVPETKDNAKEKKMKKEWCQKIRNALYGHHMWNIITYKDPLFPKTQRITIMLSIFLTTYTITLFLYGCPHLINNDILEPYIKFSFYPKVFLISFIGLIITFVIHCPLVFCLKLWRKHQKRNLVIMGWCFIATLIVSTMTILIIFGFWLPYFTSFLWLTSVIITLLVYIFLLENFTEPLNRLIATETERADYLLERLQNVVKYAELQRDWLYSNFGLDGLRAYFRHLYIPMDDSVIKEKKHFALIHRQVIEILEDLIMVTLYVLLLYILVLSDRHPLTYLNHAEVQELVKGSHLRAISFDEISNLVDVESYIIEVLIPSLQSSRWYGKYVHKDPGMTADNSNKYIGVARLRQHRSPNITCEIPEIMKFLNMTCIPDYQTAAEYNDFSEQWEPYNNQVSRMSYTWKYQTAHDTAALPYLGKFAIYPGGGYTALLGRNLKNSMTNAKYLIRTLWFDFLTRCVLIEFLLYSPSSNLFNSVQLSFEVNPTGYIVQNFDVHTAQLVFVQEEGGILLETIIVSFILILAFLVIKIIYKVSRVKKSYFKDTMRIMDIILIILSIIYLILYMNRTNLVKEFLDKVQVAKNNEFITYFHLFYAETVFTLLAALLVFLATFRLWKLLRFLVIIKIFEKTLTLLIAPLFSVVLYQVSMTFSFAIAGTILFGDKSLDFEHIGQSFMTLIILSLGLFDFNFKIFVSNIHFIYYSCYMLFTLLIYNLYVTIITISYGDAQLHYSNTKEYTVIDYLKEQFWYFSTILKIKFRKKKRMRAGGDEYEEKSPVTAKSDEHRYADCLTTPSNRMTAMAYIALNLLRNAKEPSESQKNIDEDLIKKLIVNMFMQDSNDKEIFFINNDSTNKKFFVDDLTLLKMEKIVNMLCGEDEKKNEEKLKEMYQKINRNQNERIENINHDLKMLLNIVNKIQL